MSQHTRPEDPVHLNRRSDDFTCQRISEEAAVLEHLAAAEDVFVPAVVLGELYYGARKSERAEGNITRIEEFASSTAVLGCDAITAQQYGSSREAARPVRYGLG
jgi:predicted nucleic acid-binding protein